MEKSYFRPDLTHFSKLPITHSFLVQINLFFLKKNHIWWGYHVEKEFWSLGWWEKNEWLKKWAVKKLAGAESRWECLFYYGRVFKGMWAGKIERGEKEDVVLERRRQKQEVFIIGEARESLKIHWWTQGVLSSRVFYFSTLAFNFQLVYLMLFMYLIKTMFVLNLITS